MPTTFPSVKDLQEIEGKGPWQTKSGGELNVLFNLPLAVIQSKFFQYSTQELSVISKDVRGLRSYRVTDIPKGTIGANEWHKVRHELVFALRGSVRWTCEDVAGKQRTTTLDSGTGIWVRPYILHSYEALTDKAELRVIANTLFMPDDPTTHDTYTAELFHQLQSTHSGAQK